jgi:hypothetical protein
MSTFIDPPREDNWARMSWYDIGGHELQQHTKDENVDGVMFENRVINRSKYFVAAALPMVNAVYSGNTHYRVRKIVSDLKSSFRGSSTVSPDGSNVNSGMFSCVIDVASFQGQFAFPSDNSDTATEASSCIMELKDIHVFSVTGHDTQVWSRLTQPLLFSHVALTPSNSASPSHC